MPSIIQNITLQGVPQATEQLKTLQAASVQTAAAINEIGTTGPGSGVQNVFVSFGKGADEIKKVTSAASDLKLGLRAAKPIISDLGGSFGEVGGFVKVAAASIPLFAAAFAGKTLIDLTKFNEQLLITKANLQALSGGGSAFELIAAQAGKIGIPLAQAADAVTGFVNAAKQLNNFKFVGEPPPGLINLRDNFVKLGDALLAQFRAVGANSGEATKAVKEFGDALEKNSGITADMVKNLQKASPIVANNLAQLFNVKDADALIAKLKQAQKSLQDVNNAVTLGPNFRTFADPKPITELTGALIELGQKFEGLKAQISPTADAISVGFIKALNEALDIIKEFGPSIATMLSRFTGFDVLKQGIAAVDWQSLADRFQDAMQDVEDIASQTWDAIKTIFNDPEGIDLQGLIQTFSSVFQNILQAAQSFWQQLQQTLSQQLQGPEVINPLGNIPFSGGGFASGGLIRGPGTATSDGILARVSSGEFILNAAATSHWGIQFLAALNRMQMPTLMPQSTLLPRFAEGGPVTAPAVVNLHFGGESFALQASEGVAQALRKHAVRSRLVSTGRKPSWY